MIHTEKSFEDSVQIKVKPFMSKIHILQINHKSLVMNGFKEIDLLIVG